MAYWPVAMVVLLVTGAEGGTAARAVIWLQIPWVLVGWPVKRVGVWWTAKRSRTKVLQRLKEELERAIHDQEREGR